jgi:hypothetical protein
MVATSDGTYTQTEHGLLVALGEFLQQHGLLKQMRTIPIHQKTRTHTPQAKVIEFMAGIFSGIEYLADLNDASHPLAKDQAVARAWGLPGFAHYSSVSRTLDVCDADTVRAVCQAIESFSQPFIRTAVSELLHADQPVVYDVDLMGQAVSPTSTTYPDAGFGWMDNQIQLGYQLARVCLTTRQGERIWLAGFHHPGDTVSVKCLEELVRAAESQTQVRPRRRTELVRERIAASEKLMERPRRLLAQQEKHRAQRQQTELRLRIQIANAEQTLKKPVFTARLKRLKKQLPAWQARLPRLAQQQTDGERVIVYHQTYLNELTQRVADLKTWLAQLEADNRTNPTPPICEARMDSGFSGGVPITWLIEMGYQVNTKAPSDKTTQVLRQKVTTETPWTRVGANAEMTEPCVYTLHDCPYALKAALERFKIGDTYEYATLLQYRDTPKPAPLPDWFHTYNGRQIIEAGNKELKSGIFHVQHLMSRSSAGIQLQVLFAGLAANALRWAMPWMQMCATRSSPKWEQTLDHPKHLVRVAANTAATVQQTTQGTALQFASTSALPGVILFLKGVPAFQLPLGLYRPVQNSN